MYILKDHNPESFPIFVGVTSAMNDPHLFDERALTTFTSTWRGE